MPRNYDRQAVPSSVAEKAMAEALQPIVTEARNKGKEALNQGKSNEEAAQAIADHLKANAPSIQVIVFHGQVQISYSEHDLLTLFPEPKASSSDDQTIHFA